ncbi:MAG: hypothetical protein ACRYFX_18840 [Janthinobacterium lividum]
MWRTKGRVWDTIGEYTLSSPEVPDKSTFLNPKTDRQRDQKFEYTKLPTREEYDSWPKHKQDALSEQEWSRRDNGVWFWNDGVPTWIPGQYYFFLNYHRYGDQKPEYREAHRRLYWVWALKVLPDPNCLGLFLHTRRRWGKTSIAASIALEAASGIRNFRVGIQSKTEDDAEALFLNEIQAPFLALQECPWFLPQTAGTNKPKKELLFDTPANRKKGAANTPDRLRGLRSKIDWRESTNTAYDSQGLRLFINDEVGKEQRGDPWARHSIVSKQFYPNGYVIGKEFAMTTSDENDDDSVATCVKFWTEADPALLPERKGLARYFVPDYEGYMVDAYGRDSAEGLADLDKERRAAELAGPIDWLRRRRAYPRTVSEAHIPSIKTACVFNAVHISDALTCIAEHNTTHSRPLVRQYRLYGEPGRMALTEDPEGDVYCAWLPPADWLNQIHQVGTVQTAIGEIPRYKPTGTKFGASADPFDNVETLQAGSRGAFHIGYEWDTKMEDQRGQPHYWPSHGFIVEVAFRPEDPDDYYKSCLHLCMLFGCKMFCETNKVNLEKYFRLHGCGDFLARQPVATMSESVKQQTKDPMNTRTGASSSPRMIEEYTKAKATFYQKYVGGPASKDSLGNPHGDGVNDEGVPYDYRRMPFERTLNQDLLFNPADKESRKKSDLSVSHGFGLVHMTGFTIKPRTTSANGGLSLRGVQGMLGMYRARD